MTGSATLDRLALTLCLMVLLLVLSLIPGQAGSSQSAAWLIERTPVPLQKLMHVFLYALLALLLVWTLDAVAYAGVRLLLAFLIATGFGAVMEWCQTRVPGRYGTLSDVVLNAAGAAAGLLAAVLLLPF